MIWKENNINRIIKLTACTFALFSLLTAQKAQPQLADSPWPMYEHDTDRGFSNPYIRSGSKAYGATWNPQNSGTRSQLWGIYFIDYNKGWVVGYNGTILRTADGGENWISYASGTQNELKDVHFVDERTGWAVGWYGTILKTSDGGTTWNSQTSGTGTNLQGLHFVNTSIGWAVGNDGTILKTVNGGGEWVLQRSGTTAGLFDVYFVDASVGWVVGDGGTILRTINGGSSWGAQSSRTTSNLRCCQFAMDPYTTSYVGWVVGNAGKILKTIDGGIGWESQTSGTIYGLYGVFFFRSSQAIAVGLWGTILETTSAGVFWNPQVSGTTKHLFDVFFIDGDNGWAVGDGGTILHTTNAALPVESENADPLPNIWILNQNFPNPFNPETAIQYQLPKQAEVRLEIYNLLGELVRTLVDEKQSAGYYTVRWNGRDDHGRPVASGVYLYSLKAGEFVQVRKMIIVR